MICTLLSRRAQQACARTTYFRILLRGLCHPGCCGAGTSPTSRSALMASLCPAPGRARSASWCRRRCWLASGPRGILQHPTKGKPVQSCRLHRRAMAGQTNSFIGRPHQAFGLSRWRCGGTIWSVPCASRHRRAFGQPRLPSCLPREPMSWQAQHAP
jgi:hypothetical protein